MIFMLGGVSWKHPVQQKKKEEAKQNAKIEK